MTLEPSKKQKNMQGKPNETQKNIEKGVSILRHLIESAEAAKACMRSKDSSVRIVDEGHGVDNLAESLAEIAQSGRRTEVREQVMENFSSSKGSSVKVGRAKYEPYVPKLDGAQIKSLHAAPVGKERSCANGSSCISKLFRGCPPGVVCKEARLEGETGPSGICLPCHDAQIAEYILKSTITDSQQSFSPDPTGTVTHVSGFPVTINKFQYVFGKGGLKPCIVATGKEFKPVVGVVGLVPVFDLEYYEWYQDDQGRWVIDERERHFREASAIL